MALHFTTGAGLTFHVDGSPYLIPYPTWGDLEQLEAFGGNGTENIKLFREFIARRSDQRTIDAIDKLSTANAVDLFKAWFGADQGEDEGGSPQ